MRAADHVHLEHQLGIKLAHTESHTSETAGEKEFGTAKSAYCGVLESVV